LKNFVSFRESFEAKNLKNLSNVPGQRKQDGGRFIANMWERALARSHLSLLALRMRVRTRMCRTLTEFCKYTYKKHMKNAKISDLRNCFLFLKFFELQIFYILQDALF